MIPAINGNSQRYAILSITVLMTAIVFGGFFSCSRVSFTNVDTNAVSAVGADANGEQRRSTSDDNVKPNPSLSEHDYTYTQIHMAMPVRITVWAGDEQLARAACRAAFKRISQLVRILSDYDPDSEVRRLTSLADNGNVAKSFPVAKKVSPELFNVLVHAKEIYARSGGAFDPTAGPVIQLWRHARKSKTLPTRHAIASAREQVGMAAIGFKTATQEIQILRSCLQLDLGAIAKGFIADEALKTIQSHGIRSACIEAGGDFVLGDAPPGTSGWEIDVPFRGKVVLANCGVSVSGDTFQFVVIDSVRYSHVVDPRSGMALTNRRMTVVVAPSGMQSDALATTGCIMNVEEFNKMIAEFPKIQCWQYAITAENQHLLTEK